MLGEESILEKCLDYEYVLLLGPSNSGKTSFLKRKFVSSKFNKLIISSVLFEDLKPPNTRATTWSRYEKFYFNINESQKSFKLKINQKFQKDKKNKFIIFIDEIHFFTQKNLEKLAFCLKFLDSRNLIKNLYFTMLTGSYLSTPLPNHEFIMQKANMIKIFARKCCKCNRKTTQSGFLGQRKNNSSILDVGKRKFDAMCFRCKRIDSSS